MSVQLLEERILAKGQDAPQVAARVGEDATGVLEKLMQHPDAEVREITLACINEVGGPDRNMQFIRALEDDELGVQLEARRFLERSADASVIEPLLHQVGAHEDEQLRGELALIIGRIDDDSAAAELSRLAEQEQHPVARDKIVLALARLEDEDARKEVRGGLTSGDPEVRFQTVMKYAYMDDPSVLGDLLELLEDEADVVNTAPSHAKPYYLRICDIVVNVATQVAGLSSNSPNTNFPWYARADRPRTRKELSFDGWERRRFEGQELREVSEILAAIARD